MTPHTDDQNTRLSKQHLERAKTFQKDMVEHFFDHTLFDIKDALTSILALCDMEDMKEVPQVKSYIQRVTDLLQDVRLYHDPFTFNVNHVLINLINVLKKHYKGRLHIQHELAPIKANIKSDQRHLEQLLLYSLIEATESEQETSIKIELMQKDRDAVITIKIAGFEYSPFIFREIQRFHDPSAFKFQISSHHHETELLIRLPLSFDVKEKHTSGESTVQLTDIKPIAKKGSTQKRLRAML